MQAGNGRGAADSEQPGWAHPVCPSPSLKQKAPVEALEALLAEHVRPKLRALPVAPRDVFREERMHSIATNRVLERNQPTLRAVFSRYSVNGACACVAQRARERERERSAENGSPRPFSRGSGSSGGC